MEIKDVKTIEDLYNFCKELKKQNNGKFYKLEDCNLENFENKGGVEIYFDDKEKIDGEFPRIVHIGESEDFLKRLRHHKNGNKRGNESGSIFRENIKEAIENFFNEYPYWNKQEKELTEEEIKKELDKKVSQYICELPFLIIDKGDKEKLIEIAAKSVLDGKIKVSEHWLGSFSDNDEVKRSGLWNVDVVNKILKKYI
ncbi:MAG: hypothetical protein IKO42_04310 [Opitutales bacterium]|nr:hypothetical protein [Opitutales bacterium]